MKNKNNILIVCSVIVGVCAAVATTFLILRHLKNKKAKLDCTDYMFENDFDDEGETAPVADENL